MKPLLIYIQRFTKCLVMLAQDHCHFYANQQESIVFLAELPNIPHAWCYLSVHLVYQNELHMCAGSALLYVTSADIAVLLLLRIDVELGKANPAARVFWV